MATLEKIEIPLLLIPSSNSVSNNDTSWWDNSSGQQSTGGNYASNNLANISPIKSVPQSGPAAKLKEADRDKTMESIGVIKGVLLEATTFIDTLFFAASEVLVAPHPKEIELAGVKTLKDNGFIDKDTGAFSISKNASALMDYAADKVEETVYGDLPKEKADIFTHYELGELGGSLGAQGVLAFTGGEEFQLFMKVYGVAGGLESIVKSVNQNKKDEKVQTKKQFLAAILNDPQFWVSILNAVLTLLGLKESAAAKKLSKLIVSAQGFGPAMPVITALVEHASDTSLDTEEKRKLISQDLSSLTKILFNTVVAFVQHAQANNKSAGTNNEPLQSKQPLNTVESQLPNPHEVVKPVENPSEYTAIGEAPTKPNEQVKPLNPPASVAEAPAEKIDKTSPPRPTSKKLPLPKKPTPITNNFSPPKKPNRIIIPVERPVTIKSSEKNQTASPKSERNLTVKNTESQINTPEQPPNNRWTDFIPCDECSVGSLIVTPGSGGVPKVNMPGASDAPPTSPRRVVSGSSTPTSAELQAAIIAELGIKELRGQEPSGNGSAPAEVQLYAPEPLTSSAPKGAEGYSMSASIIDTKEKIVNLGQKNSVLKFQLPEISAENNSPKSRFDLLEPASSKASSESSSAVNKELEARFKAIEPAKEIKNPSVKAIDSETVNPNELKNSTVYEVSPPQLKEELSPTNTAVGRPSPSQFETELKFISEDGVLGNDVKVTAKNEIPQPLLKDDQLENSTANVWAVYRLPETVESKIKPIKEGASSVLNNRIDNKIPPEMAGETKSNPLGKMWDHKKFPNGIGKHWEVGDPIDMPSSNGYPAWNTIRERIWKTLAHNELEIRKSGMSVQEYTSLLDLDPVKSLSDTELLEILKSGTARKGFEVEHSGIPQRVITLLEGAGLSINDARRLAHLGDPSNLDVVPRELHAVLDEIAAEMFNRYRNPELPSALDDRRENPLGSASEAQIGEILNAIKFNKIDLGKTAAGRRLRDILTDENLRRSAAWIIP
ncbi:MAG: hypothetical protein V4732_08190 [Pseudomonadota bacterium]